MTVDAADRMTDGAKLYLRWKQARLAAGDQSESLKTDIRVIEADGGRYMGFIRLVGRGIREGQAPGSIEGMT
ncbi:MAG: hypothetical protein FJ279_09895 [Planctomycetes bacterium]|nr:hypothetical protein [Planctomycetota bacterium]